MESVGHLINFTVDEETCIGCRACAEAFPDQFQMNDDINKAYVTGIPTLEHEPQEAVLACPVDSISVVDFKGRLLLTPQDCRDDKPLPEPKVAQAAKDWEAIPVDQRPVYEIKTSTSAAAKGLTPDGSVPEQWFSQFELPGSHRERPTPRFKPGVLRLLSLTTPIWGGLSDRVKSRLVELSGSDPRISPGAATTMNGLVNLLLYPAIIWVVASGHLSIFGWHPLGHGLSGTALFLPVLFGVAFGFVEFAFRLKDEIFEWGITERDRVYPGAVYMMPLTAGVLGWMERVCSKPESREVIYEGASLQGSLDLERERLYGRKISAAPMGGEPGVNLEVEFASRIQLPGGELVDLPDYVHDVAAKDDRIVVRAWMADPAVDAIWSYRNPFPLSFEREIELPAPVEDIIQERRGKTLHLAVKLKHEDEAAESEETASENAPAE